MRNAMAGGSNPFASTTNLIKILFFINLIRFSAFETRKRPSLLKRTPEAHSLYIPQGFIGFMCRHKMGCTCLAALSTYGITRVNAGR